MSLFSLKNIGADIAAALAAVNGATKEVAVVYNMAVNLMDTFETAYDGVENAGGTKAAGVIAAVTVTAPALGVDAQTVISDVKALLTTVKSAYNNALTATATPVATTTATVATPAAATASTPASVTAS